MKSFKILLLLIGMSGLIACSCIRESESFCTLYEPVVFSTYAAKAAIVDNNDTAEIPLRINKQTYEKLCK